MFFFCFMIHFFLQDLPYCHLFQVLDFHNSYYASRSRVILQYLTALEPFHEQCFLRTLLSVQFHTDL